MKTGSLALLQPELVSRAMRSFDKASGFFVTVVWLAALTFMVLAYMSVQQTIVARQQMMSAQAAQPVLPEIRLDTVPAAQIDTYVQRVSKRYGSTKLNISNAAGELRISSSAPDMFSNWMAATSYLDSIAPDITWTIKDFCVGPDCKDGLMSLRLSAQRISFVAPTNPD